MKERISKIMETEGLTPARFADEIGVQRSSISHILSGRNKPSYDLIIKMINRFSGINVEWLLTGKGTMIKSTSSIVEKSIVQSSLFEKPVNKSTGNENNENNKYIRQNKKSTFSGSGKSSTTEVDTNERIEKKSGYLTKFTDVNNVKFIVVFYENGSFDQFMPH